MKTAAAEQLPRLMASAWRGRLAFFAALIGAALVMLPASEAAARYASIVVDAETGEVLHEVNADTRNYPASLVKMMTLYMVFDALQQRKLKLGQKLPVSRRAAGMSPSRLGLKRGQRIEVRDAILALITKSANDVAVVLAEAIGKSESRFARLMNKRARQLGMRRTSFRNASGLPNRRQLSTARDMAILARALVRDFPGYYHYFSTKKFRYRGRVYRNHNKLLSTYQGADGIKTGYIRASGYNLAASSERNGRRIIAVVFGGKTAKRRNRHTATLLNRGFLRLSMLAKSYPAPPPRKPAETAVAQVAPGGPAPTLPQPTDRIFAESLIASRDQQAAPDGKVEIVPAPAEKPVAAADGSEPEAPPTDSPAAETAGLPKAKVLWEDGNALQSWALRGPTFAEPKSDSRAAPSVVGVERLPLPDPAAKSKPGEAELSGTGPASGNTAALAPPKRKPGRYGVQVGAFYRYRPAELAAKKAARKLPGLLADAQIRVTHVKGARGKIFRGRLIGLSKRDASRACRQLRSIKIDCMVVRVGRPMKLAYRKRAASSGTN